MSLSAPNAITKAVLASVKLALASYIPAPSVTPPLVPSNIADIYAGLTEGGQPPAMAADWFVGVHKDPTSQNNAPPGGRATYQDEVFTQLITISMRVTKYASSKVAGDGYPVLQDRIRVVASYFANNPYVVMAAINAELALTSTNGCIEPFIPANPNPPVQKRGRTWYRGGVSGKGEKTQGTLAVSATLRLEGLRRIQAVGGVN